MKAVNLLLLTRTHEAKTVSMLYHALSGRADSKTVSAHEAASLWSFADRASSCLEALEAKADISPGSRMACLDGFFFSYVIEHIGKEFDLLKIARDGSCILNIELKSEKIEEERIARQLEQNRYYLSHIARTIWSFTYVMENDQLYQMNEKGYLRACGMEELAAVLAKDVFRDYLPDGIDSFFKAADYLISPVASPEKFLAGQYFLTNQQFDFRRRILSCLREYSEDRRVPGIRVPGNDVPGTDAAEKPAEQHTPAAGESGTGVPGSDVPGTDAAEKPAEQHAPVIGVSGIAGTGKTLLLLDLALELSKKQRILFVHSGPLRNGHQVIDQRLKNVDIIGEGSIPGADVSGHACLLIDEADHLKEEPLKELLLRAEKCGIPVILSYDPHVLLFEADRTRSTEAGSRQSREPSTGVPTVEELRVEAPATGALSAEEPSIAGELSAEVRSVGELTIGDPTAGDPDAGELIPGGPTARFDRICTMTLAFTGNIRINRPVYSFLRTLLNLGDRPGRHDYGCIDVVYAGRDEEKDLIEAYYRDRGYVLVSDRSGAETEEDVIAREYDKVMMVLDDSFYYDDAGHLRSSENGREALRLLYEGLSRTRENLCLLVTGSKELFEAVLSVRLEQ